MVDVFISYARSDRERVRPYAEALERAGYDVWWDVKIPTGEEFDSAINRALSDAKAILVVWSKDSINSRWVKEEAEDGLARHRLIPLLLDPVVIPLGFRRIQAADFSANRPGAHDVAWKELCEQVERLVGRGSKGLGDQPVEPQRPAPRRRRPSWPILAAAVGAALLAIAALAWMVMRPGGTDPGSQTADAPPPPSDMTPVVIGIYPDDSFGPAQKRGLHLALEGQAPGVRIVDLGAPLEAMKGRNAPEVIENLERALRDRNVIAVIGPSVTEFTPQVIQAVDRSRRRPALLLTTAGPRRAIGWEGSDLPIFRVGSGVDERARQFAEFATEAVSRGRKIVFLVERSRNDAGETYGELFFRGISEYLPSWAEWVESDRISQVSFERGRAVDSLQELGRTDMFDGDNIVLVLGLGGDFAALASRFFGAEGPRRQAIMGGWMNAYAIGPIFRENRLQVDRLFDISDVWKARADPADYGPLRIFRREFGEVSPELRDETVSYDSGLAVAEAIRAAEGAVTPDRIVAHLRSARFRGIAGDIFFGADGQNRGSVGGISPLNIVQYDAASGRWTRVTSLDPIFAGSSASPEVQ